MSTNTATLIFAVAQHVGRRLDETRLPRPTQEELIEIITNAMVAHGLDQYALQNHPRSPNPQARWGRA